MTQTDCQVWPLGRQGAGYGLVGSPQVLAHRASYEWNHGPIPSGMVVRHRCDNPPCVNPDHLELGTHRDNALDKVRRGRHPNKNKTHCPQGHEYSPANTSVYGGRRYCKTCQRSRGK